MGKVMLLIDLKPDCVDKYVEFHKNAWPEFLQLLRKVGVTNEVAYLNNNQSIVFYEYEDGKRLDKEFYTTELWDKWNKITSEWFEAPAVVLNNKFYDLNEQLDMLLIEGEK